jgi:hypothetical protein
MYRPGKRLKDVSCPVQLVSGDADTCTPATSQRPWAQGHDNVAIGTGPFNHFGPFGRDSEASVAADIAFLRLRISRRNPDEEQAKMIGNEPATAGNEKVSASRFTGLRGIAVRGYHWLLLGFLLMGVVQIFLAGLGVFSLQDQTLGGAGGDTAFAPHRAVGFTMGGVALLILVLAVIARPGACAIAGSAVLVVLTSLVQSLLAGLADDHAVYGGLHAFDGLLILGIAAYLYARSRQRES